jgi:intracellular sulfur oxidation DsrE/DsrF family protein
LQDCIDLISKTDKVDDAEARKRAVAYLVPGVNLQPSGVFAVTRAQEAGASYVKAS